MPVVSNRIAARRRRRRVASMILDRLEDRRLMYNPGDPDPIYSDDYEPNDSFAAATDLGNNVAGGVGSCTITGTSTKLDTDYFKFTASQNTTVQVRVDFSHADGNLNLKLYNAAQQLVGTSDSSSTVKNYESLTFGVQAGQTYYFKVGGAKCPEYDINYRPLSANFDWSMPRTFGDADQFGLPEIKNTRDYAVPDPTTIDGQEIARFPVQFTVPNGITGSDVSYNWNIVGDKYSTSGSNAGVTRNFDLPEGTYNVTLTTTAAGASVSTSQQITVRNYLIVAIGDSYGSGEGNPHSPAQYDWAGFASRGAIWADSPDAQEALYNRMAHRSSKAGAAQAALDLENSSDKTSVTFVFLNATGATINNGAIGPQDSGEPDAAPGQLPGQLTHLRQIVGQRKIDTMIMSLGGNDMGFAQVLRDFVTNDPIIPFHDYEGTISDIITGALDRVQTLANVGYPALAQGLSQFNIGQTILTEYPDISRDSSGNFANASIDDVVGGLEVDSHEIGRAMNELMPQLVKTMITACRKFGWTYGDGVAAQYHNHGYGDWLRTATDSTIQQGPLGNVNLLTALDKQNTYGTMHPINGGLTALRDVLEGKMWAPNLSMSAFNVSAGALVDNAATYSITITNNSALATAGASTTAIYMSADASVDKNDTFLTSINVPALAPGQTVTLTGSLPTRVDPFRTNTNAVFIAPVLDYNNVVAESNEGDDQAYNPALITAVQSERDMGRDASSGALTIISKPVTLGQTINAHIGIDELIGGADMDYYAINVAAGQKIDIDIDASGFLDTNVNVYETYDGFIIPTPVASNDNGFAPGETLNAGESYLRFAPQFGGSYVIVVSHAANKNADPTQIAGRAAGGTGDYSLTVTNVPTTLPSVLSSSYDVDTKSVKFQFSTDVHVGLNANALSILGDASITPDKVAYSYDLATNTATFTFVGLPHGFADGWHNAILKATSVHDAFGSGMAVDACRLFSTLAGDANHDNVVDFKDLLVLAKNYNQTGRTFSNGNFDYSADGKVDFNDLLLLAKQYGHQSPATAPAFAAADTTDAAHRTHAFSDVPI